LDHQNNYVKRLSIDGVKSFNILTTNLSVLHNYFDVKQNCQTKLFSDLYLAKFS